MNKVVHIRRNRVYPEDKSLSIKTGEKGNNFKISKSQIVSKDSYKDSLSNLWWMKITITDWFFRKSDFIKSLKGMIESSLMFVEGDRSFRINWDEVRHLRVSRSNSCFYCNSSFSAQAIKTKDHVVPKSLLVRLGISSYPNNIVLSCKECNELKSNFAIRELRMILKHRLSDKDITDVYRHKWNEVMDTLKKIEYNGKYKGSKRVFKTEL